ncbi:MAG: hypothetical protein RMA76_12155 [Deltaproteobacteria bacterium]|jgi:hypothetical protein
MAIIGVAALAAACATEAPEVQVEVDRLDRAAAQGIAAVRRAVKDPSLEFNELGVGVETVELAARGLRSLADDARIPSAVRVSAMLAEARAYDDLTITFEATSQGQHFVEDQEVLNQIFADKALPMRTSARDAYVRARALACRTDLAEPAMMLEILDGISRYVGEDAATGPCAP